MFAYLSLIGLGIIIVSWIAQIYKMTKGYKELCICFAILQFIGIVLLVIDSVLNANIPLAIGNALSALGAIIVAIIMIRRCNCCSKK